MDNSTASPSVLLFFDKQRYLFNAGEGIQRHLIEYRKKMQKVTYIRLYALAHSSNIHCQKQAWYPAEVQAFRLSGFRQVVKPSDQQHVSVARNHIQP